MPRIRPLSTTVIAKIAAGEVIERPASVVKELLENSIDAGSTRIDIELEQGGVDRIAVIDNGHGIEPDDLALAFASHATSKLIDADDLFRIGTLGFRGEALASIGGVSQVTLQSRASGHEVGSEVRCDGGVVTPPSVWNGAPGTRIEVRHLFFNVPVRRKFLKATATEMGHISETVTRLALAYPSLHVTVRHNGKLVHELPATTNLLDRIGHFFGSDVSGVMYPLDEQRGSLRLHGWIADPACDRGNAKMQYLFLNGRWIRDRSLGHAIQEAYRGLLMVGRYAIAFLFLEMPPDQVDVNVHPTKAEVRFRDSSSLFHLVLSAIRSRLTKSNLIPELQPPEVQRPGLFSPLSQTPIPASLYSPPAPVSVQAPAPTHAWPNGTSMATESFVTERAYAPPPPSAPPVFTPIMARPPEAPPLLDPRPLMGGKALQIHDSYLVLETEDGMLVIDQHALHERILFEQLRARLGDGQLEAQRLLIPEPVDLPPDQAARILEVRAELATLGLQVDDFGGGTLLLQSYPTLLSKVPPAAILRDVVDFLSAQDRLPTRDILLTELMSVMACKAAVKAGDRLSSDQIDALLEQRHLADDHHHCPHGRPTSLLFRRQELDRQFGRI